MDSTIKNEEKTNGFKIALVGSQIPYNVQSIAENVQSSSENVRLIAENVRLKLVISEITADLKTTKNCIASFMQEMGLLDENLEMKKKPNYATVSMAIISVMRGKGEASDQFKSIQNLLPLVEKYKDL